MTYKSRCCNVQAFPFLNTAQGGFGTHDCREVSNKVEATVLVFLPLSSPLQNSNSAVLVSSWPKHYRGPISENCKRKKWEVIPATHQGPVIPGWFYFEKETSQYATLQGCPHSATCPGHIPTLKEVQAPQRSQPCLLKQVSGILSDALTLYHTCEVYY